jgi:hypothetical protein
MGAWRLETPRRTVRVPDEVWAAASARADAERVTLTAVITGALEAYAAGRVMTEEAPVVMTEAASVMTDIPTARRPAAAVYTPPELPEPPVCKHPAVAIDELGTCHECGTDVW